MNQLDKNIKADKKLAAVCGLFCASCSLYIGTLEDSKRLENMASRTGRSMEDVTCYGCRSEKRSFFCENLCVMYKCAVEKGLDFCSKCGEYPCDDLKKFQSERPHRIELWESLDKIKTAGYEKWFEEKRSHYSCKECGTINSAYDIKCRNCGSEQPSEYFEKHKNEILSYLKNNR